MPTALPIIGMPASEAKKRMHEFKADNFCKIESMEVAPIELGLHNRGQFKEKSKQILSLVHFTSTALKEGLNTLTQSQSICGVHSQNHFGIALASTPG